MRKTRFALLLVTAATVVIGARLVVSARQSSAVITACVQNQTGTIRITGAGACKPNESLLEWNMQGPQGLAGPSGPMGPMGPVGPTAPPTTTSLAGSGLQVVDSHGTVIGPWESSYVALTINSEVVFAGIDLANRTFLNFPPTYYYTDAACATPPLMYLDITHYGSVQNGVITYPTGKAVATSYLSMNSNWGTGCQPDPGSAPLGAIATASVASFVAPFSLSH